MQNDLVRGQWGWDGFIVSDCGAIGDIETPHNYTHTDVDTVAAAMLGGTDLECDSMYSKHLYEAVQQGKLQETDIDKSISRTLTHFIALGELQGPDDVVFQRYGAGDVDTAAHRALSLSVAEQAMTLMKNEPLAAGTVAGAAGAAPLLPLKVGTAAVPLKLFLTGPQATFGLEMLSNYEGENKLALNHSTLQAAQRLGSSVSVTYAPGHSADVSSSDNSTALIAEAVAMAKAADVAVVMVGLCADHCAGKGGWGPSVASVLNLYTY
jgi:beta-glucosidase-like glycosyl hydrolase